MGVVFPGDEFAYAPGGSSRSRSKRAKEVVPATSQPLTHSLLDTTSAADLTRRSAPPVPKAPAPPLPRTDVAVASGVRAGSAAAAFAIPPVVESPALNPALDPSTRHRPSRAGHLRALNERIIASPVVPDAQPAVEGSADVEKPRTRYRALALIAAVVVIIAGVGFVVMNKVTQQPEPVAAPQHRQPQAATSNEVPVGDEPAINIHHSLAAASTKAYTLHLSGPSGPATPLTMKVVDTIEDGSAVIDLSGSGHARFTVAPDGRVTSVDGAGGPFGALDDTIDQAALQTLFVALPDHAVRTGDTWNGGDVHSPIPGTDQVVAITTKGTLKSVTNGVATIDQVVDVPVDLNIGGKALSGSMHMSSTFKVMQSTGDVSSLTATITQELNGVTTTLNFTLDPA